MRVTDDFLVEDSPIDGSGELAVALRFLSEGVPLSLLLDLAGPLNSRDLYRQEAGDATWLSPRVA
jgi:hypothetical protein